jgi:transcriptional regulator with XRE-family HTH domain
MDKKDILIAEKIRNFRILKNKKQEDLGEALGLPKQAISRIEKAQRKVSYGELSKIATYLEEPIESFIEEDIKNRLVKYSPYSISLIPKLAFDFLTDYKKFLCEYKKDEARVITNEIITQLNNMWEEMFLSEQEKFDLEHEREYKKSMGLDE